MGNFHRQISTAHTTSNNDMKTKKKCEQVYISRCFGQETMSILVSLGFTLNICIFVYRLKCWACSPWIQSRKTKAEQLHWLNLSITILSCQILSFHFSQTSPSWQEITSKYGNIILQDRHLTLIPCCWDYKETGMGGGVESMQESFGGQMSLQA